VAKSGRTTGLTCASISALNLDVSVDYYLDCAETKPYLTKTFTNQLAISGNQFSDAGDSGALVVDAANAEPVGLYFAGGTDASGVSQGVANPATDVLNELSAQLGRRNVYLCGRSRPPGQLPQLRRQHAQRRAGAHAQRRGERARPAGPGAGPHAGELLGTEFWAWPPARAATTPARPRSFSTWTKT
jgi:hypothetical protein